MFHHIHFVRTLFRAFALAAALLLTGCASVYLDTTTKEVSADKYRKVEPLHPVQVLFEFQTKGVINAGVTGGRKSQILDQIKASGLFSEAVDTPVKGGALMTVTVNNVPLTDDAFSKGFLTGLTFGLAGSQVTDGYICTISYTPSDTAKAIVKEARHAIHTTLGASGAPPNGVQVGGMLETAVLMLRQVVSNALFNVTQDPNFK